MRRIAVIGVASLVAVVVVGIAASATAPTKLFGSVGPGFSITLSDAQGNPVTRVDPGPFEIEVDDQSEEHNFNFAGPGGVNVSTDVAATGKQGFNVTLVNGRYTFLCNQHPTRMRGTLDVGTSSGSGGVTTPTPPPAKPTAPVGARLSLTVGPGFTISLKTLAGRKVTLLRPGAYRITVRDRSASHNARVRGATATKATGVRFVGTQTWRVVLRKGTLVIQCDPHKATMRQLVKVA